MPYTGTSECLHAHLCMNREREEREKEREREIWLANNILFVCKWYLKVKWTNVVKSIEKKQINISYQ